MYGVVAVEMVETIASCVVLLSFPRDLRSVAYLLLSVQTKR